MLVPAFFVYSLRFDAAPVSRVVAELARASGEQLAVAEDVGRDIVALRLDGTTPRVAMDRLATALNASWRGLNLVRTAEDREEERSALQRRRLEAVRRAYAPKVLPPFDADAFERAQLAIQASTEANREKAYDLYRKYSPQSRLGDRLSGILTPAFVTVPGERRLVFHSSPNASQRPLTADQARAFADYGRELTALRLAGVQSPREVSAKGLQVIVETDGDSGSVRFRLLDKDRNAVGAGWGGSLSADFRPAEGLVERSAERQLDPGSPWGLPEMSDAPIPEAVRDRVLDVAAVEPLSPVGAWLSRCAAARGEGLVAVLGDDLLDAIPRQPITPGNFLLSISKARYRDRYDVRERDGLLWVTPLDRRATRESQADRQVLKEWLEIERTDRGLTVEERLRLTRRLPLTERYGSLSAWLSLAGVESADWNSPLVRLAAALPRNRTFRLRNLTPDVRNALRATIMKDGPGDFRPSYFFGCGTGWEMGDDPTDGLPFGIPDDALVRLDETREPCLVEAGPFTGIPRRPPSLTVERLNNFGAPEGAVRVGTCHRLDLSVDLGGGRTYQNRIEAIEGLGLPVALDAVPQPLLAAVRRAQARYGKR